MEINQPHFEKLLIESVRYCLGRMTYAVSECDEIIRQYWGELRKGAKQVIRRDIARKIEEHDNQIAILGESGYYRQLSEGYSVLGHECDAFTWIELLNWIDEQEKKISNENNGWISIKELLPCEQGYYLGYSPDWENPYVLLEYDEDLGDFLEYENSITHWQPLPQPPKE